MKRCCLVLLLFFQVVGLRDSAGESLSAREIVERMADRADEMEQVAQDWGYWRESLEKKLDGKNQVVEEKKKLRRTIWLEGKPYLELVKVNDRNLNKDELKEEAKEKAKFLKEAKNPKEKDPDEEDLTWKQLMEKYDYTLLSSDGKSTYLVSFRGKASQKSGGNTREKIFNNLEGKLWIDGNFQLIRATANLTQSLKFGLGVVGKLEKLELDHQWQKHKDVWLPASLSLQTHARVLLFKTVRQVAELRYFDPFPRP